MRTLSKRRWLIAALACAALALTACGGSDGRDDAAYEVRVTFKATKALPLEEGGPVRVAGEEVGEVASVDEGPLPGTQVVTLRIEDGEVVPLPLDTTFRIRRGAVEVKPGRSKDTASDGAYFPVANTFPVE